MVGSFNARLMEEKLKKGWTTEQFAEYLGIKPEEVRPLIQKTLTSRGARSLLARLDQNNKRIERQKQNLKKRNKVEERKTDMPEQRLQAESKKESLTIEELLKQLKKDESRLRKEICKDESRHVDCVNKRREIKELLIKQRDELLKIDKELEKSEEVITRLVLEFNSQMDEMSSLNDKISEKKEILQEVQNQIKSLKKVVIYVYDTGEIETENCENKIPDSWNQKYFEIMEMELMEALTVKQVKQLAKVISLTEFLQQENLSFDITFDSDDLKSVYEELQCS